MKHVIFIAWGGPFGTFAMGRARFGSRGTLFVFVYPGSRAYHYLLIQKVKGNRLYIKDFSLAELFLTSCAL